jgi:hypothetical protein
MLPYMLTCADVQKVTIPALLARGAERFCWVGPGEKFVKDSWVPTDVGGFLYTLNSTLNKGEAVFFTLMQ